MMIFKVLKSIPELLRYLIPDLIRYCKHKGWEDFNYWGLHLFLGMFGACKTISMVRRAYDICVTHRNVTVLTNVTLYNFPKDTKIIRLVNSEQIKELPDKSLVLIDEIGSVFNSRDFAASKRSVPKPVYQFLLQCRHRRIMLLGTVQKWNLLDKQLRDITDTVTVCRGFFKHPLTRLVTCYEYHADEYDRAVANPLLPLKSLTNYCYVQTDKLRKRFDTMEMVDNMLDAEYISDAEILANRGEEVFAPQEWNTKQQRKISKGQSRAGVKR